MHPIKNIILDFGGVILDIDFNKAEKAFAELGVKEFHNLFSQSHSSPLFELLETGKITPPEFYELFRRATSPAITDEQIKHAWNSLLLQFSEESLQWIEKNRTQYNLYLFSNTNQIHYDAVMKMYFQQTGKNNFNSLFRKAYYSHELGLRKPHREAYLTVLEKENLSGKETLLIDDTLKNIEGAKKAGLQTIHLFPPLKLCDVNI
ncbi:MAG: HAD family phosphatase [Parafilimonas sp.]